MVNTGWVGASALSGQKRISLPLTRKIIHGILDGSIEDAPMGKDPFFGFDVPTDFNEMDSSFLVPMEAWNDKDEYNRSAKSLVKKFRNNFSQYDKYDSSIRTGGPII